MMCMQVFENALWPAESSKKEIDRMTNQISLEYFPWSAKQKQAGKSVVVFNFIEPSSVLLKNILVMINIRNSKLQL